MNWLLFFKLYHTETVVMFFIIGAIIGSFLNVVIYRYPIMLEHEWNTQCIEQLKLPLPEKEDAFNLSTPRSHCVSCKKAIPFWHNIPIVSYIFLRGKCSYCREPISIQHLIVEIISAVLPILIILHCGITIKSGLLIILTWGLITLSFIDINHQFLPDVITYCLLWLGLIISTQHYFVSSKEAIYGALIGYLFLWSVSKFYILLRHKEGMGLGDCKMLGMIGAWVGAAALINVLFFSTLLALIVSISLVVLKKLESKNPIPFGPYIAIAGWCTAIYGQQLINWVLRCL